MSTQTPSPELERDLDTVPAIDYALAEGLTAAPGRERELARRDWTLIGAGLAGLVAVLALIMAAFAAFQSGGGGTQTTVVKNTAAAAAPAVAAAPTLAQAHGMKFERFQPVDPTLPAVPAGAVKHFTVRVMQHVTQVDPALAPIEAWTYTVNGKAYRGVAASPPIVVNQGDHVSIRFVNGGGKALHVNMAHSIDFHSAEVAPSKYYVDLAPGKGETIDFVAKHPGVFMYHCATQPVTMHVGAGMAGMMVVKPKGLAPVGKELWITQSEFYIGAPGAPTDMAKVAAENPDVVAFNGYANQYKIKPITVRKGERIRLYVLNADVNRWSAFHVIGTVFDKAVVENTPFHDSQTMSLAPSQGGYAEFTLDQEGNYPFVTHAFSDMVKGAAGILHTTGAPMPKLPAAAAPAPAGAAKADAQITLGDMWIKSNVASVKAGKVTFAVQNTGGTMHQFAIMRAPAKVSGGTADAAAAIAKGKMLMGGDKESVTAHLTPGSYVLVCVMPGHYAAGQHIPFTVK
ncbi:MAG TPA: multicopper oxidase domain-containing protein [Solirubrobacteraceae bacterium]|nr:multicopper oxidase domain-containing protein [Solirubrobacteraceae bacterium]